MSELPPWLLPIPALLMIASVLIPARIANRRAKTIRRGLTAIAGVHMALAFVYAVALLTGTMSAIDWRWPAGSEGSAISIGLRYDAIAALMLALVGFVGWVICRYSVRYLDGDADQGRYFRWTALTIGAVSLMVVSGNLPQFFAAWVLTSLGLHHLLLHYSWRPAAHRAAWKKFAISRIGDVALITAMFVIHAEWGTLVFGDLFAVIAAHTGPLTPGMHLAAFLLVLGAVTKSAQFPFHTWMPLTMETPTPVSALMHAGVVNAGGYLIIRCSPLVVVSVPAMVTLATVGAITACFAALVMLTQTSIKKSLAYSTIAQMGFMLLQCGLGAFSAAMLHILAHSLYKAHAFLGSGGVMSDRAATEGGTPANGSVPASAFVLSGLAVIGFLAAAFAVVGIDPIAKPGGLLLGGIVAIGLIGWIANSVRTGDRGLIARAVGVSALLSFVYVVAFASVDWAVAPYLPAATGGTFMAILAVIVTLGFGGLFLLQRRLAAVSADHPLPAWLTRLHTHASNGFYVENTFRRMFGGLRTS